MTMEIKKAMHLAIEAARKTMQTDIGGPFGAALIDPNGQILAVASNAVLETHDPTAHAEINVIREASRLLNTYDLLGCTLVTTAYPCPMCLGAIMWANIKDVIYGCDLEDAASIGFRDDLMYDVIRDKGKKSDLLNISTQERDACLKLFVEYQAQNKTIY